MDVITTHLNADFDCLGAMLAVRHLYPGALLVFPGSLESGVRSFFQGHQEISQEFTRFKDLDLQTVGRLIIVDCQHANRIGPLAQLLAKPGVTVHIYDHHPDAADHIVASNGLIRSCGSTTALIVRLLQERDTSLPTALEATVMLLGIYEDTGNLTFPGTTADDFLAAAWLLERGGRLPAISEYLGRELATAQVALLNDLLQSIRKIRVDGVTIGIVSASLEAYLSDISSLAHMIVDMEHLDALFMVVGMESRVYLIGRSRVAAINVGHLFKRFGGGGHAAAGSATLKEITVVDVIDQLEAVLEEIHLPQPTVAALMSAPVKTVKAGSTIAEARNQLTRYNVNALPVMAAGRMIGVISRRIVERAVYHGLGDAPLDDYMHTEFIRLAPETPVATLKDYLAGENQRFAPVFDGERLVGVVTRTDLLRYLNSAEQEAQRAGAGHEHSRDVLNRMKSTLAPSVLDLLRELGRTGDGLGLKTYAVGGFVRDLLLGIQNLDIDVTVEGDGIIFAETYAANHGCRVKSHRKFGTATIIAADGLRIDVASTRLEYYEAPAALPTVERSSLRMDLSRRDFTINTFAIALAKAEFGRLIDFFCAWRDLKEKRIRVLHNLSFVEDPTRAFRAIRFEQRLGFKLATHTENLIKTAIRMNFLDKLGGHRLFAELIHIFEEPEPQHAVERMATLGILKFIHRSISITPEILHLLHESSLVVAWYEMLYLQDRFDRWVVYFLAVCSGLEAGEFDETCVRLETGSRFMHLYRDSRNAGERALFRIAGNPAMPPSEICRLLRGLPVEVLLHIMARADESARRQISAFVTTYSRVETEIDGNDLKNLGQPPGPVYHHLLELVLAARIDGMVASREDELQLAKDLLTGNRKTGKQH